YVILRVDDVLVVGKHDQWRIVILVHQGVDDIQCWFDFRSSGSTKHRRHDTHAQCVGPFSDVFSIKLCNGFCTASLFDDGINDFNMCLAVLGGRDVKEPPVVCLSLQVR